MTELAGKRALVTGAASGFGYGIAERFITAGARVIVADIDGEAARHAAHSLGASATALTLDVTNAASVRAGVEASLAEGEIQILVNNAGIGHPPTPLQDVDEALFDRVLAVNAKGIYLTSRALVPAMQAAGGGVILNIASTAGVSPRPNLTWYNASKGWVITATKSMAIELAAHNIRVNALNPVAGDTPLLPTFMGGDSPEHRERFLATIPLGRFSTPQDVGNAACFLCSDAASLITGVAMEIDGGRCI